MHNLGFHYPFECEHNVGLNILQQDNNFHSAVRQHLRIR
jgi:hypothetical protein